MYDVIVLEATHHVYDSIYLAYVGEELVAETFAFAGAFYEAGDVYKLDCCGQNALGVNKTFEGLETFIRHGNDPHVRFYCTEGEIGCFSFVV